MARLPIQTLGTNCLAAAHAPTRCGCLALSIIATAMVATVLTLHDTLPWTENDSDWGSKWYRDRLLPSGFRKASAIITISKGSHDDILKLWPSLERKLHVISHGVDDAYLQARPAPLSESLTRVGVRPPYLLYMGGEIPRKRLR